MFGRGIKSNLMSRYVPMQPQTAFQGEHAQSEDPTNQPPGVDSYGQIMSMPEFLSWLMGGAQDTDEVAE